MPVDTKTERGRPPRCRGGRCRMDVSDVGRRLQLVLGVGSAFDDAPHQLTAALTAHRTGVHRVSPKGGPHLSCGSEERSRSARSASRRSLGLAAVSTMWTSGPHLVLCMSEPEPYSLVHRIEREVGDASRSPLFGPVKGPFYASS